MPHWWASLQFLFFFYFFAPKMGVCNKEKNQARIQCCSWCSSQQPSVPIACWYIVLTFIKEPLKTAPGSTCSPCNYITDNLMNFFRVRNSPHPLVYSPSQQSDGKCHQNPTMCCEHPLGALLFAVCLWLSPQQFRAFSPFPDAFLHPWMLWMLLPMPCNGTAPSELGRNKGWGRRKWGYLFWLVGAKEELYFWYFGTLVLPFGLWCL